MRIDDEKERLNDRASQAGEILFWKAILKVSLVYWRCDTVQRLNRVGKALE